MERKQLKADAKQSIKGNILTVFGYSILAGLMIFAISFIFNLMSIFTPGITGGIISIIGSIIGFFVSSMIMYGMMATNFELSNNREIKLNTYFSGFKRSQDSIILSALVFIFSFLWSLLLVVPGIIKGLSYSMSWYYLVKDENLRAKEALEKSKMSMNGHKKDLFVLYLSFIPYYILSSFLMGIFTQGILTYAKAKILATYGYTIGGSTTFSVIMAIVALAGVVCLTAYLAPYVGVTIMNFYKAIDSDFETTGNYVPNQNQSSPLMRLQGQTSTNYNTQGYTQPNSYQQNYNQQNYNGTYAQNPYDQNMNGQSAQYNIPQGGCVYTQPSQGYENPQNAQENGNWNSQQAQTSQYGGYTQPEQTNQCSNPQYQNQYVQQNANQTYGQSYTMSSSEVTDTNQAFQGLWMPNS